MIYQEREWIPLKYPILKKHGGFTIYSYLFFFFNSNYVDFFDLNYQWLKLYLELTQNLNFILKN